MLDWTEIWALTWPPQNIELVLFDRFLCSVCCVLGLADLLTDHSHCSLQAFLACCWEASSHHDAAAMLLKELLCLQRSFLSLFHLFSTAVYWVFKQYYKTTYDMKNDESAWAYLSLFTGSITLITWSICTELKQFFFLFFFCVFCHIHAKSKYTQHIAEMNRSHSNPAFFWPFKAV